MSTSFDGGSGRALQPAAKAPTDGYNEALTPLPLQKSPISIPQVRACLQHLGDASFLAAHPLTTILGYRPSRRGQLRDDLIAAVESLRPTDSGLGASRAWWRYQAVSRRYLEGQEVEAVCDSLSVSQREFYRLLREGIEAVTATLFEQATARSVEKDPGGLDAAVGAHQTFFGRRRELERLSSEFQAIEHGHGGRAIVVQGLPGVGKSRLIDEIGKSVESRGGLYLKGQMLEDAREPYDAWIEAFAPTLAGMSAQDKQDLQAQSPVFFNLLLNDTQAAAGALEVPDKLVDEAERRTDFYEAAVRFLQALGSKKPVVLALDDLHWAPALSLFSYVVRRARTLNVLVLGTIRECQSLDRPRVYDEIQSLVRGRNLSVLDLPPLSRSETASLIAARLGGPVSERLFGTIFERTLGNPFFTEELVRAMWERGDIAVLAGEWDRLESATLTVPATVSAVIEERVSRLTPDVREVLSTASVLGERFHEGLLSSMLDLSQSKMISALEDALTLGLVVEEFVVSEESYRFADPLVREVLYDTIAGPQRRELHLRALDAIGRFYEDDIERHTQELARHYHLAGKLGDGAAHAFRSGEKAEAVFAWGTAIKWYELALSLWDQAKAPPRRQAQACLKLGRLYCQSSLDAALGVSLLKRALTAFQELGEREHTAMAHLELARVQMAGFDLNEINVEGALSHLNAARATLEQLPMASGLAQVYLGLHTAHSRLGEFEEGHAWVEKAREASASTELEDPEVIAESIISAAAFVLISRGDVPRGLEMFEEAWDIASRECLAGQSDRCRQTAALFFGISLKDPRAGLDWIGRQPDYGTRWLTIQSQIISLYTLLGEFDRAGKAFDELQLRLAEAGQPRFGTFPSDPGLFLARSGRWDEALSLLTEGLSWTKSHKYHLSSIRTAAVRGGLLLEMGQLAEAEENLQWAYDTARGHHSVMNIIRTAPALCELYVCQNRLANAAVLVEENEKLAEQLAPYGGAAAEFWLASARYYSARGDSAQAGKRFQAAIDLNSRFSLPWDEAQVDFKWALCSPESSSTRTELLRRAMTLWDSIGASRYAELRGRELAG